MAEADLARWISLISFVIFTILLWICSTSILVRALRYRQRKRTIPRLLFRDLFLMGGLATAFALSILVRALGLAAEAERSAVWALVVGTLGTGALATFLYFEIFVIERKRDP